MFRAFRHRLTLSQTFIRYWIPESLCSFGAVTTGFVLPVVAVVALQATATQVGLLVVFQQLPVFVFSLFAGVWLDRRDLKTVLISVSLIQALLLMLAVMLISLHASIYILYGLATALGIAKLVLDLSYTSLLPRLLESHQLVAGNARLQVTGAGIKVLALALAGLLAKYLFPPLILLVSFCAAMISAIALLFMPAVDIKEQSAIKPPRRFFYEMLAGLRILYEDKVLRPLIASSCVSAFAVGIYQALFVIAMTRNLMLDTVSLGLLVALGGVAGLIGAAIVPTITRVIGMGRTLVLGNLFTTLGFLLIAGGTQIVSVPAACIGSVSFGFGARLFSVNQISIRQAITPLEIMARVNAGRRFVVFSFLPVGAVFGGLIGEGLAIATGLYCAAGTMCVATVILVGSSLRNRYLPFDEAMPNGQRRTNLSS